MDILHSGKHNAKPGGVVGGVKIVEEYVRLCSCFVFVFIFILFYFFFCIQDESIKLINKNKSFDLRKLLFAAQLI